MCADVLSVEVKDVSNSTPSTRIITTHEPDNTSNNITLDPDVLRWDNVCEDPVDESRRIEVYKANRRQRYINANNTKLALLAIKERK